jgi:8-amino-7-oxononanoate synthase
MDFIQKSLNQRREAGNLRSLPPSNPFIDFCSNDYLGLASSQDFAFLIDKNYQGAKEKAQYLNGSTGSRLISGNSSAAENVEKNLASIFKTEAALLFNTGYMANMGVLSAIPQKGDTVLYDELSHACIKDGIRLSFAERFSFKHNNLEDLEKKITKARGNIFVVVESIYSMDGDAAPLYRLTEICKRYHCYLIVDEAHSTGVFGPQGAGLVCALGLENDVFIRIHTFGKAMGVHGACVATSQLVKDFLINFSRPFIYTTALSLHSVISIQSAFEFLNANIELQNQLNHKISLFKKGSQNISNLIDSDSAIQVMLIQGNENAKEMALKCKDLNFDVKAIFSPTVKLGQERLRICIHSFNLDDDIRRLSTILSQKNY